LGCRNEDLGRAAVEKLKSEGITDIEFIRIDLQDLDSIKHAVKQIEETYGRCDVLVNNAAVCYNDPTLYGTTSHTLFAEQADITVKTNFFGTLSLTKAILPLMEKSSESPRIINIASSAGRLSILPSQDRRDAFSSDKLKMDDLESYMNDFIEAAKRGTHKEEGWPNTGYGVSKVGIIAMTKILARENSNNNNNKFMINSIDPGYCSTDQNNNQGFITAERGAITPYLLATIEPKQQFTGKHWYQEKEIEW
jgi:carbonyl reductase 1